MRYTLLFLFISLFSFAQQTINWDKSYRLKTEDFSSAVPSDANKKIQGLTNAVIEVNYAQKGNDVEVSVLCFFKKNESWIRTTANQEYTLNHEQGHFDIAEIFARKIRKKLQGTKLHKKNGEAQIKKIWAKLYKAYFKYQEKYDNATSHSIKEKNQAEWIKKIADELKDLEAYKESVFLMQFK